MVALVEVDTKMADTADIIRGATVVIKVRRLNKAAGAKVSNHKLTEALAVVPEVATMRPRLLHGQPRGMERMASKLAWIPTMLTQRE